jgi:dephospho-CoA kinase
MTDAPRIVLGVTGNIATGKSTVVNVLRELGAQHIDADLVYRDLVAPGQPLLQDLADHFGKGIIARDGSLDRKALGAIVFSDPKKLQELDAITHPAVIEESDRRAEEIRSGVIVMDAVKLIESGHADVCDEVWLVTAPEEMQVRRIMKRNDVDADEARRRVAAQPPVEPKLDRADVVIENSGMIDELREQVMSEWHEMLQRHSVSRP